MSTYTHPTNERTHRAIPLSSTRFQHMRADLLAQKARYEYLADQHRSNMRLTLHARRYAEKRHLRLDTVKAANCAQKHISHEPLPIIDTSVIPNSAPVCAASSAFYPEHPVIVIPTDTDSIRSWAAQTETSSHNQTPDDVPVTETESWFEDIAMDDDYSSEECLSGYSFWSDDSSMVPVYASSSDSSDGEVFTPESSPIIIRIKRKSELSGAEHDLADCLKQPKYNRKSWAQRVHT